MKTISNLFSILLIFFCISCGSVENKESSSSKEAETTTSKSAMKDFVRDVHSFAKPEEAAIKHLNLDVEVDFDKKIIKGSATYDIENKGANQIILDSKFLEIEKVLADGKETSFQLGEMDKLLGQALTIDIKNSTIQITVFYKTTGKTEALQWLNPQQTADKKHPFLLTQGQAILTRTWIPIQDSPQIRISYDAKLKVPKDLMAVMSAENGKAKSKDGVYTFKMKQAISPYLIALAVGDIKYKAISSRTGVYAEASMLDKVHNEFSDMEKMVSVAESLYGPYVWDQFDVIVLPPSFPFGGMENPRLTFATPTVIAGDKSLTSLIAHELAHSWSGNLVTNATWDDFWLNEGFTVYFEMRIMEALYGKERSDMLALIAKQDLLEEIEGFKDSPEDTHLKLNLKERNPDDGMTSIAYDKGYLFLRTLEEAVGRKKLDEFLKNYFAEHAFSTMSTEKFITYLDKNLLDKHEISFNTNEWIYKPGLPSNQAKITSDKFQKVENYLAEFIQNNTLDKAKTKDWTSQEWVHFIKNFPEKLNTKHMSKLDETFDLSNSSNSYIAMVWYEKAILKNYKGNDVEAKIEQFLINVGRRWYVSTIFGAFKKSGRVKEALAIYKKARPNYHSVTASTIDEMLGFVE